MKAIAYIDGFNLYYGALKGTQNKWLDVQTLSERIAPKGYQLDLVRYFTAKVKPRPTNPSAHTDQQAYLAALQTSCNKLQVHYGEYLAHKVRMANANPPPNTVEVIKLEEKGSDVNLAVHLLNDAFLGRMKAAILISNDSDLAEAVSLVKPRGVDVFWYPPVRSGRYPSRRLSEVVSHQRSIYSSMYKRSQLPDTVSGEGGVTLKKPAGW